MSLISSMTLGRNPVAPVRFINSENGLVIHYVAWTPPPEDFWKLNFASFSTPGSERAGIGCVIRDQNAIFKHAVSASTIGYQHSVEVELEALIFGLREAVKLGVDYLEIEGESEAAMKVVLGEISPTSHMCVLALSECVTIIGTFRKVRFHPVYDYVNRAARKLAKISMDAEEVARWSTETPPAIADILSEDVVGRYDFADSVV